MPAEARVQKMWTQQKGLIPLLFLAFSAWFLWDGLVGYPRSDARFKAHEELKGQPGAWEKLCEEKGWKTQPPEKYMGPGKYREQYWASAIAGLVGLTALGYWHRNRKIVIRNDEEGISISTGLRIPYSSIRRVDARTWKSKGYTHIYFDQQGRPGKFTLDDAKHDPRALDVILQETIAKTEATAEILRPVETGPVTPSQQA